MTYNLTEVVGTSGACGHGEKMTEALRAQLLRMLRSLDLRPLAVTHAQECRKS